ncbi:MAG: transcriptional regulator [Mesorhizobium amorphae]|nr:MAG: transcriptional regulator [Mesorhizobium amorphae]
MGEPFHASRAAAAPPVSQPCQACLAWEGGICASLDARERQVLSAAASRRHFPAGAELMTASETPGGCATLLSGVVKLSRLLADGRQQIVALKAAPDFLGRPFSAPSELSVRAVTDVHLCQFPRATFEAIVAQNPRLEHRLYLAALADLDQAEELLLALGRKTAREKVASFLLSVADRLAPVRAEEPPCRRDETGCDRIDLPLTRAEIADFLGLTFETVSRQFAGLRNENLIELPNVRRVVIRDRARLRGAAGA